MLLKQPRWNIAVIALMLCGGAACSSSKPDGDESSEVPTAEAATDAVPATEGNAAEVAAAPATQAPAPVAQAGPAETPPALAPAAESAAPSSTGLSSDTEVYKVRKGDTLMRIAFEQYGDLFLWKKIYESNKEKIKNPNILPAGVSLTLNKPAAPVDLGQSGDKVKIKKGDTLASIAKDIYGTGKRWKKLWEQNKKLITNPNKIFAGFFVYYSLTPEEKQKAEELKATAGGSLAKSAATPAQPAPQSSTPNQPAGGSNRAPASVPPAAAGGSAPAAPKK